jgi:adenylate kinase family enzyme
VYLLTCVSTLSPLPLAGVDDVTGEALTQREDDTPCVVQGRLDEYSKMTAPLLAYYKEQEAKQPDSIVVAEFAGTESDKIYKKVQPFLVEKMGLSVGTM